MTVDCDDTISAEGAGRTETDLSPNNVTEIAVGPFAMGPDSQPQPGIAAGRVLDFHLPASGAYPGHSHNWSLYIPALDRRQPLPFMVFQDGLLIRAQWNAPTVFDNLIAQGDIPPLAAIFIEAGHDRATDPEDGQARDLTRSIEYDTIDDRYAHFIIDDILPQVGDHVRLDDRPVAGGIAGASSGALCAFNAAWHRPDRFGKVLCVIGSFVDIRGGGAYPSLVRNAEPKPIRVFLQEGTDDRVAAYPELDWPAGNRAMAAALAAQGYDHRIVWGDGGHDVLHAAAIFPDALRWLWRDYPR